MNPKIPKPQNPKNYIYMSTQITEKIENFGLSKKDRPKADFSVIGIVGCGSTGQRLAVMIASKGIEVVFLELNQELINDAFREIDEKLDSQIHHWSITENEKHAIRSRITGTLKYEDFKNCDMVIEAILSKTRQQSFETRKQIFIEIEKHVSDHTIIATNSTTLAITELATELKCKNRCISMHISTTSADANLVEVVSSLYTSEATCRNVKKFALYLKKDFIRVAESPGLVTIRIFAPMINEACDILMEKVANLKQIDFAIKNSMGMRLGPFEMADIIGIDKVIRWLDNLYEEFGHTHYKASPILKRLARSKHIGVKTNEGFYKYTEQGEKLEPAIYN